MLELVVAPSGEDPRIEQRNSVQLDDLEHLQSVAADAEIVVALDLWLAPGTQDSLHERRVIVALTGADDPLRLEGTLHGHVGVAIEFKMFTDGRGYSSAALLRERLGYRGEIRAVGDVLRDQAYYMQRAGFSSFVPRSDRPVIDFLDGLKDFREDYAQGPGGRPLYRRRAEALATLARRV